MLANAITSVQNAETIPNSIGNTKKKVGPGQSDLNLNDILQFGRIIR